MTRLVALMAVLVVGCTQVGQPVAKQTTPSPVGRPVQTASPSPDTTPNTNPSPSPVPGDLPLSQVSFSCRLPIYQQTGYEGSGDFSRQGAFITFPSAAMAIDPTGKGGGYFDRAFNRWVPVRREAISPDGSHYAYVDVDQGLLHIVEVISGKGRTFSLSAIGANYIFDYATEGIYMTFGFEGLHGLWLVDPNTGSSRQLPAVVTPGTIGAGGAIWFSEVNPTDPHPINTASSAGILSDQVTRLDLKSGSKTQWLYRPGIGLGVVGLDVNGHPLIDVVNKWMDTSTAELLIAPATTMQKTIYKGELAGTLVYPIADSHGIWFGSTQGIYFYSDSGGLQKVSDQPGYPANGCF